MKIKLYSWTELHKMNNEYANKENVYGIPKRVYQSLTKHPHVVIADDEYSFCIRCSWYIPRSCVKEIIK